MRGCEADRCDLPATSLDMRWCDRHSVTVRVVEVPPEDIGPLTDETTLADVTPGYAIEAPSDWADKWAQAQLLVDSRTEDLDEARNARLAVLVAMREQGMSLGDIAKVTGLTRQRIGQLLKVMP